MGKVNSVAWSQIAEFDGESIVLRATERVSVEDCTYDLSSPREWLEYNGDGAYTVMRCDLLSNSSEWRVWEQDFHMNRLEESYQELTQLQAHPEALRQTEQVMSKLLDAGKAALLESGAGGNGCACVCMVTCLWQRHEGRVCVKGHLFSTGIYLNPGKYNPVPITVSMALGMMEPNRHGTASRCRAKLSSWCRARRPLEETFKASSTGVNEVLLVRKNQFGSLEVLEGLTSNLFVVRKNGTIHTAADAVLEGCARNMVLQQAQFLGLSVECCPISLESIKDDVVEVFVTSAVRLVVPVDTIVTVVDQKVEKTLWSSGAPSQEPRHQTWRQLYDAIISKYGYS